MKSMRRTYQITSHQAGKSIFLTIAALSFSVLFTACGDSEGGDVPAPGDDTDVSTMVQSSANPGGLSKTSGGVLNPLALPATSTASSTETSTSTATNTSQNASPIADQGAVTLTGLPPNPSSAAALNVAIAGEKILNYRYALIQGGTACGDGTYSEPKTPTDPITDSLGADGMMALCVTAEVQGADGLKKATSFAHIWRKDTQPPTSSTSLSLVYGPATQAVASVVFPITASDQGSGLAAVKYSVEGPSGCLNSGKTAFGAGCPSFITAEASGGGGYQGSLPTSVLQNGATYTVTIYAQDQAANGKNGSTKPSFIWDATAPSPSAGLTATAGLETVSLSWNAVSDGARYVVVRKQGSTVTVPPTAGGTLALGTHLGSNHFVACDTSGTTCQDSNLTPFSWYYYKVYAVDTAGNVSLASPEVSAQPNEKKKFQGVTRAFAWGLGRYVVAEWQKFIPEGRSAGEMAYSLFTSLIPGGANFGGSSNSVVNDSKVRFDYGSTVDNLYLVARETASGYTEDTNTKEIRLKLGSGVHHKISSNGRFNGQDPTAQAYLRSGWAMATDPFGNLVFGGTPGVINVLCRENTQAYYCKERTVGRLYSIVGTDGTSDGPDGELASNSRMGDVYGLVFDTYGNLYISDFSFMRIRAVCYNPVAPGACNAKAIGYIYHLAGTGASTLDGSDDIVAKNSGIGVPYGIAVDSLGNVSFADSTYRRLRTICYSTTSGGFCSGKVAGNIYYLAGSAVSLDGADGSPALSANFGTPADLVRDSYGNTFFSDTTFFRIRALCSTVSGSNHFCAGKTANAVYRVAGTGASADGADDAALASHGVGAVYGLWINTDGNLMATDSTYFRIRMFCINATGPYCSASSAGKGYRIAGINASTDGADGLTLAVALGTPRGLTADSSGNFVTYDSTNRRVRLFCKNPAAGSFCDGKLEDYHYRWIGSGALSSGWNIDSFATPMGLPQGLAQDSVGNLFVGDVTNFQVRVICYVTSSPGFCYGKTSGYSYVIAGTGATGNGADATLAIASAIGTLTDLAVDADGNLLIADNTNRTVRLVCAGTSGNCSGRLQGYSYRWIGSTTAGDTNNVAMGGAVLGLVGAVALDSFGNVWIADQQYFRIKVACRSTSGYCSGRTNGNIYQVAGTGASTDGANNAVAASTALGAPFAISVDPWDNIILADSTFFRIRYLCNNTAGGFCSGKTIANSYRAAGTGVTGDGNDDVAAASGAVGVVTGLASDSHGNFYFADTTARRIRAYCHVNNATFCNGRTSGNTYRMYGSGVNADGSSGTSGNVTAIEAPSRGALLINRSNNDLYYAGGTAIATLGSIRFFIGY